MSKKFTKMVEEILSEGILPSQLKIEAGNVARIYLSNIKENKDELKKDKKEREKDKVSSIKKKKDSKVLDFHEILSYVEEVYDNDQKDLRDLEAYVSNDIDASLKDKSKLSKIQLLDGLLKKKYDKELQYALYSILALDLIEVRECEENIKVLMKFFNKIFPREKVKINPERSFAYICLAKAYVERVFATQKTIALGLNPHLTKFPKLTDKNLWTIEIRYSL